MKSMPETAVKEVRVGEDRIEVARYNASAFLRDPSVILLAFGKMMPRRNCCSAAPNRAPPLPRKSIQMAGQSPWLPLRPMCLFQMRPLERLKYICAPYLETVIARDEAKLATNRKLRIRAGPLRPKPRLSGALAGAGHH